jgi:hypothetical protein
MTQLQAIIHKVGPVQTITNPRKDGSGEFTVTKAPVTLRPFHISDKGTLVIDWDTAITYWTADEEVIASARECSWNAEGDLIQAVTVDVEVVNKEGVRPVTYKLQNGEARTENQCSVEFSTSPVWDFLARPVSPARGNLAEARAKAGLSAQPASAPVNASDKPF